MRLWVNLDELNVAGDWSKRRRVVEITWWEPVALLLKNFSVVEVSKNRQKTASIPVISHTSAIVAFTGQVHDGVERHCLILVHEHLTTTTVFHCPSVGYVAWSTLERYNECISRQTLWYNLLVHACVQGNRSAHSRFWGDERTKVAGHGVIFVQIRYRQLS